MAASIALSCRLKIVLAVIGGLVVGFFCSIIYGVTLELIRLQP